MKAFFLVLVSVAAACGGQSTVGDAGSDAGNDAGGPCTTNAQCATGDSCGFVESEGCSDTVGTCFPTGAVCNLFSPGCSCAGETINIACNGLPAGYSPAALAHTGECGDGAADQ